MHLKLNPERIRALNQTAAECAAHASPSRCFRETAIGPKAEAARASYRLALENLHPLVASALGDDCNGQKEITDRLTRTRCYARELSRAVADLQTTRERGLAFVMASGSRGAATVAALVRLSCGSLLDRNCFNASLEAWDEQLDRASEAMRASLVDQESVSVLARACRETLGAEACGPAPAWGDLIFEGADAVSYRPFHSTRGTLDGASLTRDFPPHCPYGGSLADDLGPAPAELWIRNARVSGHGAPGRLWDVRLSGGRIASLTPVAFTRPDPRALVIDASGATLHPGLIDEIAPGQPADLLLMRDDPAIVLEVIHDGVPLLHCARP